MKSKQDNSGKSKTEKLWEIVVREGREEEQSACAYPKGVLFTGSRMESEGGVVTELAMISPGRRGKGRR